MKEMRRDVEQGRAEDEVFDAVVEIMKSEEALHLVKTAFEGCGEATEQLKATES